MEAGQPYELSLFCEKMLDAVDLDTLDPVITSMVSERLLEDSLNKDDFPAKIRRVILSIVLWGCP